MEHSQTLQPIATNYTPSSKPMPWIISPLNEIVERSSQDLSGRTAPCSLVSDTPLFREHHEADSIELFSDLFFVANLATFTAHHHIENAQGKSLPDFDARSLMNSSSGVLHRLFHPALVHMAPNVPIRCPFLNRLHLLQDILRLVVRRNDRLCCCRATV